MKQDKSHGGVAEVSVEQPDLIDLLASAEGEEYNTFLPSFAQQRLWFLDQLEPGNPLYNIPAVIRIGGPLNVPALEQTLTEIVARHEALRTTFTTLDAHPVQLIRPPFAVGLPVQDLSDMPEAEREPEARRLLHVEAQQSFDLARGPLLRAGLLRLSQTDHIFMLTLHHIVSDGWSMGILIQEMIALYEAAVAGRPSSLAELDIQYADYAVWQREWLEGEVLEEQLAYWKTQLAHPAVLELPTDKRRPLVQSFAGAMHTTQISATLHEALKTLSQREGVTMFMTLLAALKLMLWRYSGQTDLIVGTPIAGRTRVETEPLIGLFVNTLALRTDLSGDPTFCELLGRVREVTLGAYAHQDVPFERLVEELQPERSLSHAPLFQVMITLKNTPSPELAMAGLQLSLMDITSGTSKFDLTLLLEERDGGITIHWEYNTDLFEPETVVRMSGHYETLLESIVARPAERITLLPMLPQAERQQLLVGFNDTARAYPPPRCLHELFAAQVARTPHAVALIDDKGEQLTYGALAAQADELAQHLRSLGVGPEVRVGVLLHRSPQLVVALLGILKAGGAYVPLDPQYPQERISFMVADAAMSVLLTETSLRAKLPASAARIVCLDTQWMQAEASSAAISNPTASAVTPDNLAYVIYTSGSTGRPKGVAIAHKSVATFLHWAHETFTQAELAGVLAATSVCFDLSVFELFAPLTCGGAVILAENALALPPHPANAAVTLVNTVPSAMAELARAKALPPSVTTVNLAGEPLKRALVEAVYAHETVARVLNLYGPSEDTTYSTYVVLARGTQQAPTIGRPVANTQVYLLDQALQLVPIGVAGELYLGGAGLARGYLNRPALTAEQFVPNPFSAAAGGRLYRTGDVARYLPTGELEFLGRSDHQVKVRGFRIELGEVETALRDCEGVREAIVMARAAEGGGTYLAAYLIAGPQEAATVAELRRRLKERLPDYMIPAAFVFLEELPLTPNGKVDRRALPEPARAKSEGTQVPPLDPVEEILAGIWAEVLRLDGVGREANFFELGGHSLLATQLISRARAAFGVELPLRRLFEEPTVAGLARIVRSEMAVGRGPDAHEIKRAGRASAPPLSFAQQRFWFLDQLEPGNARYNIPLAVRLAGVLDAPVLEGALLELVRRHEILRTTFAQSDGQPVQIITPDARVALDATDLSDRAAEAREAEARQLVVAEAVRPFDLARGPLMRARLLRLGAEEHILCLVLHHIISDGWSMGVLVREVAALYAAATTGEPAQLAELPVQYADYAVWQRARLRGGELERQLAYWRAQLAGAPPVLELPTDRPRPPAQTFRGRTQAFALPQELRSALQDLSRREGVTLFMTLLACFKVLLARYAGQEDFVLGAGIANRNSLATEGLIGCFVNVLPLRANLAPVQTMRELLRAVREDMLAAHAHQDIPFEVLLEKLQPERRAGYPPLFQVTFFFQNVPRPSVELPGLSLKPLPVDSTVAKFDLMLVMDDRPDGLVGGVEYNIDLFDDSTIARLIAHFEQLLRDAAAHPDKEIHELTMTTAEESRALSAAFNDDFE
jgi:amino acid adenylation domain-containing protein